jgi:uncharacterized CHY-type Zn-finger protein
MKIKVLGNLVDAQTRCEHYATPLDIIAIKFHCCNTYYPCFSCHEEVANHKTSVWPKNKFNTLAILCGVCQTEMSIYTYLNCENTCPHCNAAFNPKCQNHYHLYFDVEK